MAEQAEQAEPAQQAGQEAPGVHQLIAVPTVFIECMRALRVRESKGGEEVGMLMLGVVGHKVSPTWARFDSALTSLEITESRENFGDPKQFLRVVVAHQGGGEGQGVRLEYANVPWAYIAQVHNRVLNETVDSFEALIASEQEVARAAPAAVPEAVPEAAPVAVAE